MKHLNIHDIALTIKKKNERRLECFEKILLQVTSRIRQGVNINMFSCLFEIPEYLLGYPVYDLNECLTFIIDKLKTNGFYVDYYFPRVLHISWNSPNVPKLPSNPALFAPSVTIPQIHDKCESMREQAVRKHANAVPRIEHAKPVVETVQELPTEVTKIDDISELPVAEKIAAAFPQVKSRSGARKKVVNPNKLKLKPLAEFKPSGRFVLTSSTDPETESAPSLQ